MTKPLLRPDAQFPLYPPITDPETIEALFKRYGDTDRLADIIAGRDQATADDIAAWRSLGAGR